MSVLWASVSHLHAAISAADGISAATVAAALLVGSHVEEINERMSELVEQAMRAGAVGLSIPEMHSADFHQ